MSIVSLHTNLDRSPEARAALPALVGMAPESSLEHAQDPDAPGLGIRGIYPGYFSEEP